MSVSKALGDFSLVSCMTKVLALMFKEQHSIYDSDQSIRQSLISKWKKNIENNLKIKTLMVIGLN